MLKTYLCPVAASNPPKPILKRGRRTHERGLLFCFFEKTYVTINTYLLTEQTSWEQSIKVYIYTRGTVLVERLIDFVYCMCYTGNLLQVKHNDYLQYLTRDAPISSWRTRGRRQGCNKLQGVMIQSTENGVTIKTAIWRPPAYSFLQRRVRRPQPM
jgi:hypothetical protein